MTVPTITLNAGNEIPQLGFGVFLVEPGQTERIVSEALEVGYRHIDTAKLYDNETGVGKAIEASGIPREELFITTKLGNSDQGRQSALDAFDLSLAKLGLDYVDLYLIHWPIPSKGLFIESWLSMEEVFEDGRAKSIGTSNFMPHHLEPLLAATTIVPAADQIELHPYYQQGETTAFCKAHGIAIEAWGPLGQAKYPLLELPEIASIADAHGKTAAQVVLRWHIQEGYIIFPKSNSKQRMAENFDIFDFELTTAEQASITALERGGRVGGHPDEVGKVA
jgi:2,5-diketo-D-gluconate reductase A